MSPDPIGHTQFDCYRITDTVGRGGGGGGHNQKKELQKRRER